tara:strand:+ start:125 stop:229 length:105 start_codon:yes stop_codon:yes gene_type:complete
MLGSIILMLMGFWIVGLVGGILIGKMLWTPPGNN